MTGLHCSQSYSQINNKIKFSKDISVHQNPQTYKPSPKITSSMGLSQLIRVICITALNLKNSGHENADGDVIHTVCHVMIIIRAI